MATYTIAGETFSSKKAIETRIQSIANSKTFGEILSASEQTFMFGFFEQFHPKWSEKKGAGVKAIQIARNQGGHRGFMVVRVDGTREDAGWKKCLNNVSHVDRVKAALRNEIIYQKNAVRDAAFKYATTLRCPITEELFTRDMAEVDHEEPTLAVLIGDWIARNHVNLSALEIAKTKIDLLADRSLANSWHGYHLKWAKLRVLSKKGHRHVS